MFKRIQVRDDRVALKKQVDDYLRSAGLECRFRTAIDVPIGQARRVIGRDLWTCRLPVLVFEVPAGGRAIPRMAIFTDAATEDELRAVERAGLPTLRPESSGIRLIELLESALSREIGSDEQFQVAASLDYLDRREDVVVLWEVALRSVVSCIFPTSEARSELVNFWNSSSSFDALVARKQESGWWPVLAVEYNGNQHLGPDQINRDRKKYAICESADLPVVVFWQEHLPPDLDRLAKVSSKLHRKLEHRRRAFYDDFLSAIVNFVVARPLRQLPSAQTIDELDESGVFVAAELLACFAHEGPYDLLKYLSRLTGCDYAVSVEVHRRPSRRKPLQRSSGECYSVTVTDRAHGVVEEVLNGVSMDIQGGEFPLVDLDSCLKDYLRAWVVEYLFSKHRIEETADWGPMRMTSWGFDQNLK